MRPGRTGCRIEIGAADIGLADDIADRVIGQAFAADAGDRRVEQSVDLVVAERLGNRRDHLIVGPCFEVAGLVSCICQIKDAAARSGLDAGDPPHRRVEPVRIDDSVAIGLSSSG